MDVVDQLRYRDAELKALAENGHDRLAVKQRLAALYRAQGINVSDQILDAGIAAQRERRYVYVAPTGWKAWLAGGWVARRRVFTRLLLVLLAGVVMLVLAGGWAVATRAVKENQAVQFVGTINQQVADVGTRGGALAARLRTLEASLDRLQARATTAHPDRLAAMLAHARTLQHEARQALAAVPATLPTLARDNAVTHLRDAADTRDQQAVAVVRDGIIAAKKQLGVADTSVTALADGLATLATAVDTSEQLEAALQAARAAGLGPDAVRLYQRAHAAGDAALRIGQLAEASAAVQTLRQTVLDAGKRAALGDALAQLRSDGLASGVSGADKRQFDAAVQRAETTLRAGSLADAGDAQQTLANMVELLRERLEYRIVNRGDTRSGVWRYNENAADGRNYYLVAEALDDRGQAALLDIRNEETGTRTFTSTFAVRVPQAVYDRVAADKQDNGLIEDDLIGVKERGRLSPTFSVPVAGGYITEW